MALRRRRDPGLRRAPVGRAGFVALACALYLGAGVSATWPAILHADSRFLAGGAPGNGEAAPGDHLQTGYHLWLPGHQLEHGRAPWLDPYTFQPEASPRVDFQAWPFGIPYWPLVAALGPVRGWNLFVLLTYLAAGGLACLWLREARLTRGGALAGGLAFALAPYRVEQSVGHLLGPISALLPLALYGVERARRGKRGGAALAALALASIPLSGQVHLALGAIPFFALYALCRARTPRVLAAAGAGIALAVGAGLLVREASISGSIASSGRSLDAVTFYSASWLDLVTRHLRHGNESFVYLGWATTVLAAVGLGLLLARRRYGLALALLVGALVPIVLALGTNTPLYAPLWHHLSPLRYPRVPERLMPIADLALAGLVGVAASRPRRLVPALVVVLLFLDLHVRIYGASAAASGGERAYAALAARPAGRLLELPVFTPDLHYGSVYLYYDMTALRERPGGYSTVAPLVATTTALALQGLDCGDWTGDPAALLRRLGVRYVALHRGLYRDDPTLPDTAWFAWRGLVAHGFRPVGSGGAVTTFAPGDGPGPAPPFREPDRGQVHFCQGWKDRALTAQRGAFWAYGAGTLSLRLAAAAPVATVVSVDGVVESEGTIAGTRTLRLPLAARGWHLVTVDASLRNALRLLAG